MLGFGTRTGTSIARDQRRRVICSLVGIVNEDCAFKVREDLTMGRPRITTCRQGLSVTRVVRRLSKSNMARECFLRAGVNDEVDMMLKGEHTTACCAMPYFKICLVSAVRRRMAWVAYVNEDLKRAMVIRRDLYA